MLQRRNLVWLTFSYMHTHTHAYTHIQLSHPLDIRIYTADSRQHTARVIYYILFTRIENNNTFPSS